MHATRKNYQLDLFDPDNGTWEYSAVATNLPFDTRTLWRFMGGRGMHEKAIGELKTGLAFDTIPTDDYQANSVWQQIVLLAHNLLTNFQIESGLIARNHLSDEFVEFALAAKKAKMRLSPDVYYADGDVDERNAFDSTPEQLLEATADCDKVRQGHRLRPESAVLRNRRSAGIVADFVKAHPDRFISRCSVNPGDEDCIEQLFYCVETLGLHGLKIAPMPVSGRSTTWWRGRTSPRCRVR